MITESNSCPWPLALKFLHEYFIHCQREDSLAHQVVIQAAPIMLTCDPRMLAYFEFVVQSSFDTCRFGVLPSIQHLPTYHSNIDACPYILLLCSIYVGLLQSGLQHGIDDNNTHNHHHNNNNNVIIFQRNEAPALQNMLPKSPQIPHELFIDPEPYRFYCRFHVLQNYFRSIKQVPEGMIPTNLQAPQVVK